MNEEAKRSVQPPEESLAEIMSDPDAAPQPVEADDPAIRALGIVGVILVTAGGILLPLSMSTRSTLGGTRSAKIQWQERQAEIRRVVAADEATSAHLSAEQSGDRDGN